MSLYESSMLVYCHGDDIGLMSTDMAIPIASYDDLMISELDYGYRAAWNYFENMDEFSSFLGMELLESNGFWVISKRLTSGELDEIFENEELRSVERFRFLRDASTVPVNVRDIRALESILNPRDGWVLF